jgi:MFS family permease
MAARLENVARAYGRVIASPSYFPLWSGQLVSNLGDTLHYIALVVLVYQMTGQGLAVAGLVAAEVVPVLVLGPVAGVIIDRLSRKAVLIGADVFRAALVITLLWPQDALACVRGRGGPRGRQHLLQSDRAGRHPGADH